MPRLHPNLADLYRHKFINLAEALNDANTRLEAAKCIRAPDRGDPARAQQWKAPDRALWRARSPYQSWKPTPPAPRERGCDHAIL
jgi:hypothetical protein